MNSETNDFIKTYRDSLKKQYDTSVDQLNQERINAQTSIMSNANRAGMLYSNFPARDKIKYDTQTYEPALISARQSYQTGLDKLRENTMNYANQISELEKKIAELNAS